MDRSMQAETNPLKIVVADAEPLARLGVECLLKAHPQYRIVAMVENGLDALAAVEAHQPQVLITEINLTEITGPRLASIVRGRFPRTNIIAVTRSDTVADLRRMQDAGAIAAIPKSQAKTMLLPSLQSAMDGRAMPNGHLTAPRTRAPNELTDHEAELIALLADGWRASRIADKFCLSKKTVEAQRRRLMRKLGIETIAGLTKYAVRNGLSEIA